MNFELEWKSVLTRLLSYGLCGTFFVVASVTMAVPAWAHRDRGPDDPCRRQIGASLLHLTLYQPQFNPDEEYCEEVPRAGKAVLVVDVTAGELRQVPIAIEVVATDASGQQRTVLSLPPQIYERGVADSEMIFDEGNAYVARVVVGLGSGQTPQPLSFPIRVVAWYTAMIKPTLMVVGLLALTAISVIRYRISSQQDESFSRVHVRRVTD
ncbi:MAG: hypothetical protein HYZ50_18270 [Deltaproteobacteria bacterium]|nr:hypothetical protein [Deltaproteobacteria bacterium]